MTDIATWRYAGPPAQGVWLFYMFPFSPFVQSEKSSRSPKCIAETVQTRKTPGMAKYEAKCL